MWTKEWDLAELDFKNVKSCGYSLYQGDYKKLFKRENEQCDEMIFSAQCYNKLWLGNFTNFRFRIARLLRMGLEQLLSEHRFCRQFRICRRSSFLMGRIFPG